MEELEGHEQRLTEGGKTRADHARGKHDDRIFAASMSYFTMHDMDKLMEREHKRCNTPQAGEEFVLNTDSCLGLVVPGASIEDFERIYADR